MRLATAAVVLIGAIAVAGCNNQPPAPKTYTVIIASMAYAPTPPAVRTGDTIHWVNNDIFQHSVTAKDGSFDVDLQPKASADTVIKHAGTIDFFCKYHPGMTGRLSVAGKASPRSDATDSSGARTGTVSPGPGACRRHGASHIFGNTRLGTGRGAVAFAGPRRL